MKKITFSILFLILFQGFVFSSSLSHTQNTTKIKALWNCKEGDGTIVHELVSGHHGTLVNGVAWVSGKEGSALWFDGQNDHVEGDAATESLFDYEHTSTFSAIVMFSSTNTTSADSDYYMTKLEDAWTSPGWTIEKAENRIRFLVMDAGSIYRFGKTVILPELYDGKWHTVGFCYHGNFVIGDSNLDLYFDGVRQPIVGTENGGFTSANTIVGTAKINLGSNESTQGGYNFQGKIGCAAISPEGVAWTSADFKSFHNQIMGRMNHVKIGE